MEKEQLINMAYQLAHDYDVDYGFCPQCVLAAVQDVMEEGISDDVIRSAHGLSGGGCLTGNGSCGALQGGLMAISCFYGRKREDFGKGRFLKNLTLGKKLLEKFTEKYGSEHSCHGLQTTFVGRSFDSWNPEDAIAFKESGCKNRCAEMTGDIAKWVVELLMAK